MLSPILCESIRFFVLAVGDVGSRSAWVAFLMVGSFSTVCNRCFNARAPARIIINA